jgi:hypothetical protein
MAPPSIERTVKATVEVYCGRRRPSCRSHKANAAGRKARNRGGALRTGPGACAKGSAWGPVPALRDRDRQRRLEDACGRLARSGVCVRRAIGCRRRPLRHVSLNSGRPTEVRSPNPRDAGRGSTGPWPPAVLRKHGDEIRFIPPVRVAPVADVWVGKPVCCSGVLSHASPLFTFVLPNAAIRLRVD